MEAAAGVAVPTQRAPADDVDQADTACSWRMSTTGRRSARHPRHVRALGLASARVRITEVRRRRAGAEVPTGESSQGCYQHQGDR